MRPEPCEFTPGGSAQSVSIARLQVPEPVKEVLAPRIDPGDPLKTQKPLPAVGQGSALLHEALALAQQTLSVLLGNARNPDTAQDMCIASIMREQCPNHRSRINTIRLALPGLAVHKKARRVQDNRFETFAIQNAGQPKAFETRFIATKNPRCGSDPFRSIFTIPLDQRTQTARVRGLQDVKTDFVRAGRLQPNHSALRAEFNRNIDCDIFPNNRCRAFAMRLHARISCERKHMQNRGIGSARPIGSLLGLTRCCAVGRQDRLEDQAMSRATALRMIKRRARQAGLPAEICAHSFRGTGITEYLRNGGDLEVAARIAGHESTRTTQLYNRVQEEISLDEIERIHI